MKYIWTDSWILDMLILFVPLIILIRLDEWASKRRDDSFISKQQKEKLVNKQTIYELLETKRQITNNEVETLLGISDATATRYLDELEKEGKVRQVGKTGRYVSYERV